MLSVVVALPSVVPPTRWQYLIRILFSIRPKGNTWLEYKSKMKTSRKSAPS
jgi:hypothetical protein